MADNTKDDLHYNGVHTECTLPPNGKQGNGTHSACELAGKVERFHGHDYDGPLVCGCEELGS